jgi:hypothetical protein
MVEMRRFLALEGRFRMSTVDMGGRARWRGRDFGRQGPNKKPASKSWPASP